MFSVGVLVVIWCSCYHLMFLLSFGALVVISWWSWRMERHTMDI